MSFRSVSAVVLIMMFSLALVAQESEPKSAQPVLYTSFMDTSVDPCVDFYTYSCGGWMKNNPIPPDQSSWSTYGKLQDENLAELRDILEQASKSNNPAGSVNQKIGDYYASCMDEAAIEKLGAKPLEPELARIAELKSKQDIADYLAPALRLGHAVQLPLRSGFQRFKPRDR